MSLVSCKILGLAKLRSFVCSMKIWNCLCLGFGPAMRLDHIVVPGHRWNVYVVIHFFNQVVVPESRGHVLVLCLGLGLGHGLASGWSMRSFAHFFGN